MSETIFEKFKESKFNKSSNKILDEHLRELSLEALNIKNESIKEQFRVFFTHKELDLLEFKKLVNLINNIHVVKVTTKVEGHGGYGSNKKQNFAKRKNKTFDKNKKTSFLSKVSKIFSNKIRKD